MEVVQAGSECTKKVTWRSGSNVHGPHSCYTASSLQACTYGLMGSSYNQLTEQEKAKDSFTDGVAGYTGSIWMRTDVPFWDISEEKRWRETPVGKT